MRKKGVEDMRRVTGTVAISGYVHLCVSWTDLPRVPEAMA